jgi:hypothetical protein
MSFGFSVGDFISILDKLSREDPEPFRGRTYPIQRFIPSVCTRFQPLQSLVCKTNSIAG